MPQIRLPQSKTVFDRRPYSPGVIDSLFELVKGEATPSGWVLTATDPKHVLIFFILQDSPYAAAELIGDRFRNLNLSEFFKLLSVQGGSHLTLYATSPILFKCLLVAAQKNPTTAGTTDLLNLEGLMNQIKSSRKEVVVGLKRGEELNLFYFLKGALQEGYFADPSWAGKEGFSEDLLLEYAYSGNAQSPITVQAYHDTTTTPAEDADLAWHDWPGGIVEYYLRERPELVFLSGGESLDKKVLSKSRFTIGRGAENDLTVSGSLASREHAQIKERAGQFILEDRQSRNGTLVNGKKVSTATLSDGDEIRIGDLRILFIQKSPAGARAKLDRINPLETTVVGQGSAEPPSPTPVPPPHIERAAHFILEVVEGKRVGSRHSLKSRTIIGRSKADINTGDPKTSRHHAAIERKDDGFYFTDLKSTNGSLINNQEVHSQRLAVGDLIRIGDSVFRFIEVES